MKIRLEISRGRAGEKPRIQGFDYEYEDSGETVAAALEKLDRTLDDPIKWQHSCLQKKCGACAMLINGRPRLACDARLSEFERSGTVRLEPLKKFPLIADLTVDRTPMMDALKDLNLWLENEAELGDKAVDKAFNASKCIQCGCCLEVCPNFYAGGSFKGMAAAAAAARLIDVGGSDDLKALKKAYDKGFYSGCGKSLACKDVCPAGIDTEDMLVSTNAAAIWGRRLFK